MRYLIFILTLLCQIATAEVTISVSSTQLTSCPQPEPEVIKMPDGTYERKMLVGITAQACWAYSKWEEVWTDYPDKGGKFIRRAEGSEKTESLFDAH